MKTSVRLSLIVGVFAVILSGCGNKANEKRIAELESELAEIKKQTGGATATATVPSTAAEKTKPEGPLPEFEFAQTAHDFGEINEGDVVEHIFTFTNTGDAPLIIQNATGSCGCTVPEWSKEPIPIGGTGEIKAVFNSKGKPNTQNKTVTVTANTWPETTRLSIKAFVNPATDAGATQVPAQ
ncbi:MAG: DUF1573 domain-containing protein [Bacteroidota bacterium]